ncbi:MAG: TraR/DksA C4-type zinc finger protein [Bacillota bacterium]|nr:TraR/DksA C4-type zinc finger protein [Bacillota bacterium]
MEEVQQLRQKKEELEQLIQKRQDRFSVSMAESTDELSLFDQHPADVASELSEREKDAGFLELLELELEKVNDALSRAQTGQYGICESCGQPIEQQRLARLCNTTVCAGCAQKLQPDQRELRGGSITSGTMSDMGETINIAGYEMFEE